MSLGGTVPVEDVKKINIYIKEYTEVSLSLTGHPSVKLCWLVLDCLIFFFSRDPFPASASAKVHVCGLEVQVLHLAALTYQHLKSYITVSIQPYHLSRQICKKKTRDTFSKNCSKNI